METIKGMRTCSVCKRDFPLMREDRYTVSERKKTGLVAAFGNAEPGLYDAIDCPHCGCQNVLQVRMYPSEQFCDVEDCPCEYGICDECEEQGEESEENSDE